MLNRYGCLPSILVADMSILEICSDKVYFFHKRIIFGMPDIFLKQNFPWF